MGKVGFCGLAICVFALVLGSRSAFATSGPDYGGKPIPVTFLLRVPGSVSEFASAHRAALAAAPSVLKGAALRTGTATDTLQLARLQAMRRNRVISAIAPAARRFAARSLPAYRAILNAGGQIVEVSTMGATITARVPPRALAALLHRADIDAVHPWRQRLPLNLGQESASVGAPTWWAAGFRGGRGSTDIPANLAVDQDPVLRSHPAFDGITFEMPPGSKPVTGQSVTRHGTALLSIAAAQGPTGCSLCHAADADEKGVALGVSKVLDPSGVVAETDWAAGIPYYWYDNATSQWKLQPGASDPAQVINYSRGNEADYDDSLDAQQWDATVDSYGVTATVAAGNSGPALKTINDPALAYNVIGVGAFSGGGTSDPSDDSIFPWSSRGPTVGGRKKPDLVAVGDGGLAYSYYQSTGQLWKYDTGTSYSAPQVAGGAILLAGAGIRDPKVVKAILINSARPGRVTPASAMGTQTGWQPDWGWGELNLDAAFRERLNFARGEIPSNGARFFRAAVQQPGDRATLTWNRRVADCKPLRQGCYYDTESGFRVYALSNLDLTQYDAPTGTRQATSASAVDNVEQVRSPASGSVVYKVTAADVDGPEGEPFAITATRPLTPLATPQPTTALTASAPGPMRAGQLVRIQAQATNPSPDLPAENAQVTLALPAGVELVEGQRTQSLGTLTPTGTPGDRAAATWTVRSSLDGVHQLVATTTASKYGSTFRSSAAASFSVDAAAPRVTIAAPGGGPTSNPLLTLAWSATDDGSGVQSYDVDVSTNGEPYVSWLPNTSLTSATFSGTPGSRYAFRVRATDAFGNTSPFVSTPEIEVARETIDQAHPPDPPDQGPLSPELSIKSVRRTARRLIVRGTVARGANGKLVATWTPGRKGRRARGTTYAQLQAFTVRITLGRKQRSAIRGTLLVRYLGGDGFATQSRRLGVRSRG